MNTTPLEGIYFWEGVVEDRLDPLELGRVRVRIFGLHTEDKSDIPIEELPWAAVVLPVTSASVSGLGDAPVGPVENTWVVGYFRDGAAMQEPVVLGTLPGKPQEKPAGVIVESLFRKMAVGLTDPNGLYPLDDYLNEKDSDTNRLARITSTGDGSGTIVKKKEDSRDTDIPVANSPNDVRHEPMIPHLGSYPYNHVKQTEGGHVEEWDDTPGSERYHRYHPSGTYVEVQAEGHKVDKVIGDNYELRERHNTVHVKGSDVKTVDGRSAHKIWSKHDGEVHGPVRIVLHDDLVIEVNGNVNYYVDGDVTETVKGNYVRNVFGNSSETVGGNKSVNVNESSTETVGVDKSSNIGGNKSTVVGLDMSTHVVGSVSTIIGASKHLSVADDITTTAGKGQHHSAGDYYWMWAYNHIAGQTRDPGSPAGGAQDNRIDFNDPDLSDVVESIATSEPSEPGSPNAPSGAPGAPVSDVAEHIPDDLAYRAREEIFFQDIEDVGGEGAASIVDIAKDFPEYIEEGIKQGFFNDWDSDVVNAPVVPDDNLPPVIIAPKGAQGVDILDVDDDGRCDCNNRYADETEFPLGMRLSPNVTLGEVTTKTVLANSRHKLRAQKGLTRAQIVCNLEKICRNVAEPIFAVWPDAYITSGFRNLQGSRNPGSFHHLGQALDFQFPDVSTHAKAYQRAIEIAQTLPNWDKIILELNTSATRLNKPVFHIQYRCRGNRGATLTTANFRTYTPGFAGVQPGPAQERRNLKPGNKEEA